MASLQILEISSEETPMEELSYDVVGNINGGQSPLLILELFNAVRDFCVEYSDNPQLCVIALLDLLV